jgi:CRP/FNR family transcriptional regulator, cyclic AMP receptor protein
MDPDKIRTREAIFLIVYEDTANAAVRESMGRQTPEQARLIEMLRRVPLFSELDKHELDSIVSVGREVSFKSGQKIITEGEQGLSFLMVLEGKTEVRKKGKRVAVVKPGGFFGEMTVFDDKPRSADIVAVEPTKCFGIASWSFFPMLRNNPAVAIGIIRELVHRLRRLDENSDI